MLNYQLMNSVCLLAKFMCLSAILVSMAPLFVSILMNILLIKTILSIIIEKYRYALYKPKQEYMTDYVSSIMLEIISPQLISYQPFISLRLLGSNQSPN